MAYNTKLYKSTGSAWEEIRVASEWSLIANKPSTFTPTAHAHSEYLLKTEINTLLNNYWKKENLVFDYSDGTLTITTG